MKYRLQIAHYSLKATKDIKIMWLSWYLIMFRCVVFKILFIFTALVLVQNLRTLWTIVEKNYFKKIWYCVGIASHFLLADPSPAVKAKQFCRLKQGLHISWTFFGVKRQKTSNWCTSPVPGEWWERFQQKSIFIKPFPWIIFFSTSKNRTHYP